MRSGSRFPPPARTAQDLAYFRHRHRYREDHNSLEYVHHLLRHEGVNGKATLRERREEKRGDYHAEWMVPANKGNRDAQETSASGEPVLVVMLVTEDVIDSADPRDHARQSERSHPNAADADAAVLGRFALESHGPELVPAARAEEIEPDCDRHHDSDDEREIGGRPVKSGIDVRQPRQNARMNLRSVERLRHVEMTGDEPVEQSKNDEVQHDRDDDFVRAESRLEVRRNRSDSSAREAGRDHAEGKRHDERRA